MDTNQIHRYVESLEGDDARRFMEYEFTSSGILCTNHINCRDQLCVNLDTGELILHGAYKWYEFTSSGILCTNHINCRDQLCVNLDTGELIRPGLHCNLDWR